MNFFRWLFQRGMSAGELRVRLDQIHQAILHSERRIIMTNQEQIDAVTAALGVISTSLSDTGTELAKDLDEINAEIIALNAKVANGQPSDFTALSAKVAALSGVAGALKAQAQALDDLNPDTPPAPAAP